MVAAELQEYGQQELARQAQAKVNNQVAGQARRETQQFAMDLAAATAAPDSVEATPGTVLRKRAVLGATPANTANAAAMAAAALPAAPALEGGAQKKARN